MHNTIKDVYVRYGDFNDVFLLFDYMQLNKGSDDWCIKVTPELISLITETFNNDLVFSKEKSHKEFTTTILSVDNGYIYYVEAFGRLCYYNGDKLSNEDFIKHHSSIAHAIEMSYPQPTINFVEIEYKDLVAAKNDFELKIKKATGDLQQQLDDNVLAESEKLLKDFLDNKINE